MSGWRAAYTNNYGEYEITFESKNRAKTKAVEKVCCAIMDGLVKSPEDVIIGTRPKGTWVSLEPEIGLFGCSRCEHIILRAKCNYCPTCGARMEG